MKGREVAEDVHLLPERFWRTPALQFSEEEIEAVMVSTPSIQTVKSKRQDGMLTINVFFD